MKKIILLLALFSFSCFAQISQAEFDKSLELLSGDDQQKAIANLELLEKKFPNTPKVLYLRGIYQFRDGDINAAMSSLSNAVKSNPQFALGFAGRAQLFSSKGMFDKAIADLNEAIRLEPKNSDFINSRYQINSYNQNFAEALKDVNTKITLNPLNALNYLEAAQMSLKSGENKADDYFAKAYLVKGIDKYSIDALYGEFLLQNQRFEEANAKYDAAITSNPDKLSCNAYGNAGIVAYKLKNYDMAINYLTKAIAMNPQSIEHRANLATVYVDKQDFYKVKQIAEQLLAINSEDAMANMLMAIGIMRTGGDQNLALQYQQKAQRLDSEKNK